MLIASLSIQIRRAGVQKKFGGRAGRTQGEELSESLRQQTATAEVLKTISRRVFDLQRVLETLLENAVRICGANHGMIFRYDGECCRAAASYNTPPGYLELWERTPIRAGRGTTTGRALLEGHPVQIADVLADPEYNFPQAQELMGFRTVLAVPLLREGVPLGTIGLWKTEVAPFTDKQIELLTTFADQAVIEAVRGIHPGRCHDRPAVRGHRTGPRHHPQARPHDGRRCDGDERAGQRLSLHGAAAGRGRLTRIVLADHVCTRRKRTYDGQGDGPGMTRTGLRLDWRVVK